MNGGNLQSRFKRFQAGFFLGCVALTGVLHWVLPSLEPWITEGFARYGFSLFAGAMSLLVLLITDVSYPRIYRLKPLLTGYILVAFTVLFVLQNTPALMYLGSVAGIDLSDKLDLRLWFLLQMLNLAVVIIAPSYTQHTRARRYALYVFFGNVLLYGALLIILGGQARDSIIITGLTDYFPWIMGLVMLLVVGVAWGCVEEEHNFGAVVTGIAVLVFYSSFFLDAPARLYTLQLLSGMVFIFGTILHWLNCLHHKAQYDPLLKIYNRQFMNAVVEGIADVGMGERFSVLLCDLDHFKKVNDTYGHLIGDRVLFQVAQAIREEALPEGIVCRYGGEEMIVFLRRLTGKRAELKAERIRAKVESLHIDVGRGRRAYRPTASIGVSSTDRGLADIKEIIRKADEAVYQAKEQGRNRVVLAR